MIWHILTIVALIISAWAALGVHYNTKTIHTILDILEIMTTNNDYSKDK